MKIILTRNSGNQKQETGFQHVGNLARNICFLVIASLNFTSHSKSIELFKRIFLHVISARIIVPCSKLTAAIPERHHLFWCFAS